MQISIQNPEAQTLLFIIVLSITLLIFIKKDNSFFNLSRTNELKGFAILAIIFSHIGYSLISGQKFLYPLSVDAGVGVNIFLFLSGYGLTISALKKDFSIKNFYIKRLTKLYTPLWVSLIIFFILDFLILNKSFNLSYIISSFYGLFPSADLFNDINSPLWYFTIIVFYYLLFPLVFIKKYPYLSAIFIYLASIFLLTQNLPINSDLIKFYKLHTIAFPLGIIFSSFIFKYNWLENFNTSKLKWLILPFLIVAFGYFSINSGVGQEPYFEQNLSIITMLIIILIFILKNIEFKILELFGIYSFEIYLIHWPILSRYDFLYKNLPAALGTIIYLIFFIILGFLLRKLIIKIESLSHLFSKPNK